jgi:hypothetical protein
MEIEKRHKIATLMASIADVDDSRFSHAGYSDDQMVRELVALEPHPELLGRYMVDLGRKYGADLPRLFDTKLQSAVNEIPDGHSYIEVVKCVFAGLSNALLKAPHAQVAKTIPFDEDLPSAMNVMSHIEAQRGE